jgi:hypothetical protein
MWDLAYWRKRHPEPWETAAFVARCHRRAEVMFYLIQNQKQEDEEETVKKGSSKIENRRYPRTQLDVYVRLYSEKKGFIPGRTVDLSESGIAAILPVELKIGESVILDIEFPSSTMNTRATVRYRDLFRHGFEFDIPACRVPSNFIQANRCDSCGGSGYVLKPQKPSGDAFAQVICERCAGTGNGKQDS